MTYQVRVLTKVEKTLSKIDLRYRSKIRDKIRLLADDPRPMGVEKLSGKKDTYRIRVGMYRIVYEINDSIVLVEVIEVDHRKDVYR